MLYISKKNQFAKFFAMEIVLIGKNVETQNRDMVETVLPLIAQLAKVAKKVIFLDCAVQTSHI